MRTERNCNLHTLLVGMYNDDAVTLENKLGSSSKAETELPRDPAIPFPGMYKREMKNTSTKEQTSRAELLIIV